MDQITKILNSRISNKIAQNQPGPDQLGKKVDFKEVLETKKSSMEDLVQSLMNPDQKDVQVQSVEHIDMNLKSSELSMNTASPSEKGFDLFAKLNDDFNSMDMAIEVLSDPNIKLNKKQLLAYQAGIGNLTVNIELFTKMAQAGVRAVQRFTDMQI